MANSRERLAVILYTLIAALFFGLLIAEYRRAAKAHGAAHSSVEQRAQRSTAVFVSELRGVAERNTVAIPLNAFDA
jgi:hypothetical protein